MYTGERRVGVTMDVAAVNPLPEANSGSLQDGERMDVR